MKYFLIIAFVFISIGYSNCGSYDSLEREVASVSTDVSRPQAFVKNDDIPLFDVESPQVLTKAQFEGSVYSDFYFFIMPDDYRSSFEKEFSGESSSSLEDISYDEPFKTELSGLNMDYKYNYKLDYHADTLSFDMNAKLDRLNFSIDKIITEDSVEQTLGGVSIKLPIKGECRNLQFKSQAAVDTKAKLSIVDREGEYFLESGNLEIDLENIQWEISVDSCVGPEDYESLLRAELLKLLKDRSYIIPILESEMHTETNALVKEHMRASFEGVLKPYLMNLEANGILHLIPDAIDIVKSNGALKISGKIVSYFKTNQGVKGYRPFVMSDDEAGNVENSGFLISQEFIELFNKSLHANDAYVMERDGGGVKGFKGLLNLGSFKLSFVWPDLRSYSAVSQFLFKFSCTQTPQEKGRNLASATTVPKLTLTNASSGQLSLGANFKLNTDLHVKRNNKFIPYMHYRSDVTATGSISIVEDKLVFQAGKPEMSLNFEWNQAYVNEFRPNQKFDSNRFRDEIEKSMSGEKYERDLPTFEVGDSGILYPKSLRLNGKAWLQVIYLSE